MAGTTASIREWSVQNEASRAAVQLRDSVQWMRGDMAAVMRLFAEQHNANVHWADRHPEHPHADVLTMLTEWIQHYYGFVPKPPQRADTGLSSAPQLVQQIMHTRADSFAALPIHVLPPRVFETILMLAGTDTYRREPLPLSTAWEPTGLLVLPTAILRRNESRLDQMLAQVLGRSPEPDTLSAVSWLREPAREGGDQIRVGDWIVPEVGYQGSGIDDNVGQALAAFDNNSELPPWLWTNEQIHHVQSAAHPSNDARRRIHSAANDLKTGTVVPWTRGSVYDDAEGLLALRLTHVAWDAVQAGILCRVPLEGNEPAFLVQPS
ncbi:hypothetical protein ACLBYD_24205 [Rhodococcus sp. C26F]|uniref:hypothetical protein n=1 Tax=Rhodococcus pyridinivorans TaxID=103816 RepID=UPI0020C63A5C|nr:hypothetical protein [Rhodococcus pyridinivorans]UTM40290.1 hypothetical protein MX572_25625 [Rhodococcus pyridinivorans]WAL49737.1 hypothetical protein OQN32_27380 [Rhodococcus pyridinivorans]